MARYQFDLLLIFSFGLASLSLTIPVSCLRSVTAPMDDRGGLVDNASELSLLFMIHRHGDRAPYSFAPKDPWKDSANDIWKLGLGMVTNEGKQRMYKLGKYIRRRYSKFLTENPNEVHTWSSDVDRCIVSAQLVLAGLYPPEGSWAWNEELAWQPMPIHTRLQYDDPMLNVESYCPTRDYEYQSVFFSDELKRDLYQSNEGRFIKDKLMAEYGFNFSTPYDYYDAYSTLGIERCLGLALPDWLTGENFQTLGMLAYRGELLWTHTDLQKRMYAGVILEDMVDKMKQVRRINELPMKNTGPLMSAGGNTKLYHYSTHDTNIHSILNTLGAYHGQVEEIPDFGATILVEFYRNGKLPKGDYSVRLLYLGQTNDEDKGLRELRLTPCAKDGQSGCSLDDFDRSTRKYQLTPKEWLRECGRTE